MEWIFFTGVGITAAATVCFIISGRQKGPKAAVCFLKESRSILLLIALLWGSAALMFGTYRTAEASMETKAQLYYLLFILADIVLGAFSLLYMVNRLAAVTEEGVTEINAFGDEKFLSWNEIREIRPPDLIHSSYVFVGRDGTVIPISGAKGEKERFVHESAKRLPENLKRTLMDSLGKKKN